MDCEQARSLLSRWVDGELDEATSRELEAFVANCPKCQAELEQLQGLGRSFKAAMAPPPVSEQEWREVVVSPASIQARRMGWLLVGPAAVSLVVAALVAFFTDPSIRLWIRVALGAIVGGFAFLFFSVAFDRWQAARVERYGQVDR